jgi:hypothetical protein
VARIKDSDPSFKTKLLPEKENTEINTFSKFMLRRMVGGGLLRFCHKLYKVRNNGVIDVLVMVGKEAVVI